MDKLVYLTYPLLLAALLAGSKFYGKNEWNEEFMSLKQTKYIQGFYAICIMLHHIGQETCASWQTYTLRPGLEPFVQVGYLFVSVFLFCSGYGLYKSYKNKSEYLKGFFTKRIVPLIVAFYTTGWIFLIARVLMHEKIDGRQMLYYIIGWSMPNLYTWYVIAMPFFYLCFYLSFRFLKSDSAKIWGVVIGVFAYTFLGTCINHNNYWMRGEWWYNSVHLFWIGILFARYDAVIIEKFKKRYALKLVLVIIGALLIFRLSEIVTMIVGYYGEYNPMLSKSAVVINRWICLISQMLASAFYVTAVLMINMKLKISNKLLGFMGGITLEFYLIHGLFLELFARQFCDVVKPLYMIQNVALLELVVFTLGIAAALVIKKLDGAICSLLSGAGRREKKISADDI